MTDLPMIPIIKPFLGEEEVAATRRVIESGWLTQGAEVAAFEKEFAALVGAQHAVAVSNCTTALHLGLLAVGVGAGDEVITVSHSYIATANAIRYCGATPVFVDIAADGFNMDPALLPAALTPKTKAILCVHQIGMPCDMTSIVSFARQHNLAVVEDAACALGSEARFMDGPFQRIGNPMGDVVCFSFHPRKIITTGDGGMLTTNNAAYAHQFRLWRQHGMNVPDTVRHNSKKVIFEDYPCVGYNYRLTDLQACVGREQLKRLDAIVKRRREGAALYHKLLADAALIKTPVEPSWARTSWQSYCVTVDDSVDQYDVMQYMLDHNIATRRGIMCSHREQAYADIPLPHALPRSEKAQDKGILLPLYHAMTEADQIRVADTLREACKAGQKNVA